MKSILVLSLLSIVLVFGMSSAYADEKYECEVIESCGEMCEADPNCEISKWAVQSQSELDGDTETVESLKSEVVELKTKNALLESQIEDLKSQLENAQQVMMAQLNMIMETLANLKIQ